MLADHHIIQPQRVAAPQPDAAVNPQRRQSDIPVPARIALRFAQEIVMRQPLVPEDIGHREGKGRRLVRRHGRVRQEPDLQPVPPLDECPAHIEIMVQKTIAQLPDLKPVQGHDGMAIHPVQHQRMTPLGPRGQVEVTRGQPFAFVDPVQTDLAVAPIGIVDQPRRQQCRMDIAGKVDGQPFIPANPAEAPAAIQHQITCRKTLVIHGAVLSAVSAGGMDLTMHPISPIPFC